MAVAEAAAEAMTVWLGADTLGETPDVTGAGPIGGLTEALFGAADVIVGPTLADGVGTGEVPGCDTLGVIVGAAVPVVGVGTGAPRTLSIALSRKGPWFLLVSSWWRFELTGSFTVASAWV